MRAVTQWFYVGADPKPSRIGTYEVEYFTGCAAMRFWDGKDWRVDEKGERSEFGMFRGDKWRGLAVNPLESRLTDPYEEGVEAANAGRSIAQCPYQFGTKDGDAWVQGFTDNKEAD